MNARPEKESWRYGTASTPILTAGAVYAGGLVANLADAPPGMLGLAGATSVAAPLAGMVGLGRDMGPWQAGYTGLCTGAIGGWLAYAAAASPWTWDAAAGFGIAATALGLLYPWYRWTRRDRIAQAHAGYEAILEERGRTEWERILDRAGHRGIVEIGPRTETRAGYTLHLGLPADGRIRYSTLNSAPALEGIATAARGIVRLRPGALRVERTGAEGELWLHVSTRDVLAETTPLPDDCTPLSIHDPFPVGVYEDGEPIMLSMRSNAVLIVGMKGSGKSVLLHVLIAQLARCVDAVIWAIDMGGGATVRPWLEPWLTERKDCGRPVIDWPATTADEAMRLLNAATRISDARSRRVRGKLQPSAQEPAIVLVTDELPKLMALMPKAAIAQTRLKKESRKAAIETIDAVQRGTVPNTGGGEAASQYDTRFGLKVATTGETQYALPGARGVDLSLLPGQGALVLSSGDSRTVPGRGYFVDDESETVIPDLAAARTWIRPDLDDRAAADAGEDYATRWAHDRIAHLLDGSTPAVAEQPAAASGSTVTATRPTTYRQPPTPEEYLAQHGLGGPPPEDEWDRGLRELIGEVPASPLAATEATDAPEMSAARSRMYEILAANPERGVSVGELVDTLGREGHGTARQTVSRWLKEDVEAKSVERIARGRYRLTG